MSFRSLGLSLLALLLLSDTVGSAARVIAVEEAWRSPFGTPRSVSLNPTDGTVWAAAGASVVHFREDGTTITQVNGFRHPVSVSVNPQDGSCWVADVFGPRVVHLSRGGVELWSGDGFLRPFAVSANSTDASCWVADGDNNQVVHLAEDGTELVRVGGFYFRFPDRLALITSCIAVNPNDGSLWVADTQNNAVVHLTETGAELWRGDAFLGPTCVSVNTNDSSVWVADRGNGQVVHLDDHGAELLRTAGFVFSPGSVAVCPADGSVWVGSWVSRGLEGWLYHLTAEGAQLWRNETRYEYRAPVSLSVHSGTASCWVADCEKNLLHYLRADGAELWQGRGFSWIEAYEREGLHGEPLLSVNPTDGSCWVADIDNRQVVHLAGDGAELWRSQSASSAFRPLCVSVNPNDGSCWEGRNGIVVHRAEDGTVLWRSSYGPNPEDWQFGSVHSLSASPLDGSCWVLDSVAGEVIWLAPDGTEIWRGGALNHPWSVAGAPSGGSCWVLDAVSDQPASAFHLIHLASGGAELFRRSGLGSESALSVDQADGSLWLADPVNDQLIHLAPDGTELWTSAEGALSPRAVCVSPTDGSVWTLVWVDADGRYYLMHLAVDGTELWRGGVLNFPVCVAVDDRNSAVWVADERDNQVIRFVMRCSRFDDVPCGHWAVDYINACSEAGIVSGYPDGCYHPDSPVTRDQMAVFVSRGLAGGDDHVPTGPAAPSFDDVPTSHWAFRYVEYAVAEQVVAGYPDGLYHPDYIVDRGQMAVFIAHALAGNDASIPAGPDTPTFPDVTPTGDWSWCCKHVEFIASEHVTQGYGDGLYHPEVTCSRDQMAVFVARAFGLLT